MRPLVLPRLIYFRDLAHDGNGRERIHLSISSNAGLFPANPLIDYQSVVFQSGTMLEETHILDVRFFRLGVQAVRG